MPHQPQPRASEPSPSSFCRERVGLHHPRAEYSSQLETCENTCECTSGRQSQPSPPTGVFATQSHPGPAFTPALGKGMARNGCWVPDMGYPCGLLPDSLENTPALSMQAVVGPTQPTGLSALFTVPKSGFED